MQSLSVLNGNIVLILKANLVLKDDVTQVCKLPLALKPGMNNLTDGKQGNFIILTILVRIPDTGGKLCAAYTYYFTTSLVLNTKSLSL